MRASLRDLARRIDPVRPPTSFRGDDDEPGLASLHRWMGGSPPGRAGLRAIASRHLSPESRRLRFLWLNTELLISAGARHDRARELAAILTDDEHPYDLVALCEVLGGIPEAEVTVTVNTHDGVEVETRLDTVLDVLIDEVRRRAPGVQIARGPAGTAGRFSSGLVTFAFGLRLTETPRRRVYNETGSSQVDSSARKGMLLASVDVGPGTLDLYSTHLASGVRILDLPGPLGEHVGDVHATQMAQVDELLDFFVANKSRHPKHVSVVCGDFNIAALDTERVRSSFEPDDPEMRHRDRFLEKMAAFRLEDSWPGRGGPVNYTFYDRHDGAPIGFICDPAPDDSRFCDDDPPGGESGVPFIDEPFASAFQRLDYVFVERPGRRHAFRVDWSRPRRLPFHRPETAPAADDHPTMSDHLGVEIEFVVSPV